MEKKIISIADALRRSISVPADKMVEYTGRTEKGSKVKEVKEKKSKNGAPGIIEAMNEYDCSGNTHMLHPRLDARTVKLLNSFKLASGIDMNRFIAFSIHYLFQQHPELKTYIKHSLENFEL